MREHAVDRRVRQRQRLADVVRSSLDPLGEAAGRRATAQRGDGARTVIERDDPQASRGERERVPAVPAAEIDDQPRAACCEDRPRANGSLALAPAEARRPGEVLAFPVKPLCVGELPRRVVVSRHRSAVHAAVGAFRHATQRDARNATRREKRCRG